MELWNAAVLPLCPLSSSPCCLLIYTGLSPTAPWFLPLVHDSKLWILLRSFLGSQYVPDQIDQASYSSKQAILTDQDPCLSRSIAVIKNSSSEWVQEQPYTSQVVQGMCPIATQARPDSTYVHARWLTSHLEPEVASAVHVLIGTISTFSLRATIGWWSAWSSSIIN
jgi:hypothetical protein